MDHLFPEKKVNHLNKFSGKKKKCLTSIKNVAKVIYSKNKKIP